MAIVETVDVITNAMWPQGDIRDPLGIWGFRHGVTGDASGGTIKVTARAAEDQNAAYLYTCYSTLIADLEGASAASNLKCRLLTNWPNVDPQPGVQAYATLQLRQMVITTLSPPESGPFTGPLLAPNDRFILLFDPRPSAGALDIVELELDRNVLAETYSFEGYGYYWDRSVLDAPGGPRHPGSN